MRKPSVLDEPIEKVLTDMNTYGPDSPEYTKLIEHLDQLTRMKSDYRNRRFSPDTMLIVAGNLLGILIIVAYEQKHVMVSRGLGFVIKAREPNKMT
ncbi:MAG: hypothetical protein ABWY25_06270 [Paenisporosarcina sp.]